MPAKCDTIQVRVLPVVGGRSVVIGGGLSLKGQVAVFIALQYPCGRRWHAGMSPAEARLTAVELMKEADRVDGLAARQKTEQRRLDTT